MPFVTSVAPVVYIPKDSLWVTLNISRFIVWAARKFTRRNIAWGVIYRGRAAWRQWVCRKRAACRSLSVADRRRRNTRVDSRRERRRGSSLPFCSTGKYDSANCQPQADNDEYRRRHVSSLNLGNAGVVADCQHISISKSKTLHRSC